MFVCFLPEETLTGDVETFLKHPENHCQAVKLGIELAQKVYTKTTELESKKESPLGSWYLGKCSSQRKAQVFSRLIEGSSSAPGLQSPCFSQGEGEWRCPQSSPTSSMVPSHSFFPSSPCRPWWLLAFSHFLWGLPTASGCPVSTQTNLPTSGSERTKLSEKAKSPAIWCLCSKGFISVVAGAVVWSACLMMMSSPLTKHWPEGGEGLAGDVG